MESLLLATALTLAPLAANAADPAVPTATAAIGATGFTYALFETTVEHADLATCPPGIDTSRMFCRLTLASDLIHVFIFALDGDQTLTAIQSYDMADGLPRF